MNKDAEILGHAAIATIAGLLIIFGGVFGLIVGVGLILLWIKLTG